MENVHRNKTYTAGYPASDFPLVETILKNVKQLILLSSSPIGRRNTGCGLMENVHRKKTYTAGYPATSFPLVGTVLRNVKQLIFLLLSHWKAKY
jgi:hypothetical protein